MKSETYLRHKIFKMIKTEFSDAWVYHPADRWVSGIPDYIICLKGKFIAIEIKTPTGKVSKIQFYTLDMIKEAGGIACVVRSVDEARKILLDMNK